MANRKILAILLCFVLVFSAGCAGWGQDGPADTQPQGGDGDENADEAGQTVDGEPYTVTLSVVDENGDPVTGTTVSIATYENGIPTAEGTTDENGEVQVELDGGSYEISVAGHYIGSEENYVVVEGDTEKTVQTAGEREQQPAVVVA